MRTVNIHEAKTNLSRLVEAAAKGEPFVIARAGKPLVKVAALETTQEVAYRRIGFMPDLPEPPEDFDTLFADEIVAMFEGDG